MPRTGQEGGTRIIRGVLLSYMQLASPLFVMLDIDMSQHCGFCFGP